MLLLFLSVAVARDASAHSGQHAGSTSLDTAKKASGGSTSLLGMTAEARAGALAHKTWSSKATAPAPPLCFPGSDPCRDVLPGSLGKVLEVVHTGLGEVKNTVILTVQNYGIQVAPASPELASASDTAEDEDGSVSWEMKNASDQTAFRQNASDQTQATSQPHKVQLTFTNAGTLRYQVAPFGVWADPKSTPVTAPTTDEKCADWQRCVNLEETVPTTFSRTEDGGFIFASDSVEVQVSGNPFLMTVLRDGKPVWTEGNALGWNSTMTTMHMHGGKGDSREMWFGGGMQNGYMEHSGRRVGITEGGGWDVGGHANPSPFAVSSRGYGMFMNTFAPGEYNYWEEGGASLAHAQLGVDAYIFVPKGGTVKDVLGLYIKVIGNPVVIPVWAMGLGDSNCYNDEKHGHDTSTALPVEKAYGENDMPLGWMMVNDGYGCGYSSREQLAYVDKELHKDGFRMGLWTENGLENAPWEIGTAGSRVIKTDVKWVGQGFAFGIRAVKQAADLMKTYGRVEEIPGAIMEGNGRDSARPFTWSVCGWGGTSSYAIVWTGDSKGNWEYIRMQVPTIIGSGLSGIHLANGDVDGIFGGSAETYVRDLQWKTYLPVAMTMSGWSPKVAHDRKQPYAFGEPYTAMNRASLRMRHALRPYMYSLVMEAHKTGVPPVRSLGLEFPGCMDSLGRVDDQFMSGPFLFVAPVMTPEATRAGIRLPGACSGETWVNFWTGKAITELPTSMDVHDLTAYPLFVRAGAVLPLWDAAIPGTPVGGWGPTLRLEVFVPPKASTSSFTLYEDDGDSMAYANGEQAAQELSVTKHDDQTWSVAVGESVGDFAGKLPKRSYSIRLYNVGAETPVALDGTTLPPCRSSAPPCVRWDEGDATFAPTQAERLGGMGAVPDVVIETGLVSLSAPLAIKQLPAAPFVVVDAIARAIPQTPVQVVGRGQFLVEPVAHQQARTAYAREQAADVADTPLEQRDREFFQHGAFNIRLRYVLIFCIIFIVGGLLVWRTTDALKSKRRRERWANAGTTRNTLQD